MVCGEVHRVGVLQRPEACHSFDTCARFAERAVYLDCDIAVFSRLTEMIDLLETSDLVLVPHMLAPLPRPEQFWTHPTRPTSSIPVWSMPDAFGINLARCSCSS